MIQNILSAKLLLFPVAAIGISGLVVGASPLPVSHQEAPIEEPSNEEELVLSQESTPAIEQDDTGEIEELRALFQEVEERVSQLEDQYERSRRLVVLEDVSEPVPESEEHISQVQDVTEHICSLDTMTFTPEYTVIFHEIAWMGDTNSPHHEWIELRNLSDEAVSLEGWHLLNGGSIDIAFKEDDVIGSDTFFLLTRGEEFMQDIADKQYTGALRNTGESLYLIDGECRVQDIVTATPSWTHGDNTTKHTMERTSSLSWQTSSAPQGTPKRENSPGMPEQTSSPVRVVQQKTPDTPEPSISLTLEDIIPSTHVVHISLEGSSFQESIYDVKVAIEQEGTTLSRTYHPADGQWKSSQFYLSDAFNGPSDALEIELELEEGFTGKADVIARIRESGTSSYEELRHSVFILSFDQEDPLITESSTEDTTAEEPIIEEEQSTEETSTTEEEETDQEETEIQEEPGEQIEELSCIDINTASLEELTQIVHIGESRGTQIIELRQEELFSSVDDLVRVDGISEDGVRLTEIKEEGLACVL